MSQSIQMSGAWSGWYDYGGSGERVPFTAWFETYGIHIEGTTLEPNTLASDGPEELMATLLGSHEVGHVAFHKRYAPGQFAHDFPIDYAGSLMEDGRKLMGEWRFAQRSFGSGRFCLERASGPIEAVWTRDAVKTALGSR